MGGREVETIRRESVRIDRAGLGVGGVLYQAGRQAGLRGARLLQRSGLQGEDLLEAARIAFEAANRGRARWRREAPALVIEVEGSVLAEGLRPQKKPICHPLAGHVAGFLEVAFQRPVRVRERICSAMEGSTCEFVAEIEQ